MGHALRSLDETAVSRFNRRPSMAKKSIHPKSIHPKSIHPKKSASSDQDVDEPKVTIREKASSKAERKDSLPPTAGPVRRATVEVDMTWLEEAASDPATNGSSPKPRKGPPPLPASVVARPKRKGPPPLPREEAVEKPTPRRSTRPPKR